MTKASVIQHTVKSSDTLQNIAKTYYNDSSQWLSIALFNKLDYPYIAYEDTTKHATGYITLYRDPTVSTDVTIPSATTFYRVTGSGNVYYSLATGSNVVLPSGLQSIEVPIASIVYGVSGQALPNTITNLTTPVTGVSSVSNNEPISLYPKYNRATGNVTLSLSAGYPATIAAGNILATKYTDDTNTSIRYYQITTTTSLSSSTSVPVRALESGDIGNIPSNTITDYISPSVSTGIASIDQSSGIITLFNDKHGVTSNSYFRVVGTRYNNRLYQCSTVSAAAITINTGYSNFSASESSVGQAQSVTTPLLYIETVSNPSPFTNGSILSVLSEGDILLIPDTSSGNTLTNISSAEDDPYVIKLKQDIYLSPTGDLGVDPSGDLMVVSGLDNLKQAIRLRLSTRVGTLMYHPTYGSLIENFIGSLGNLLNLMIIKKEIIRTLSSDPRVQNVESVTLNLSDRLLDITVNASIIGKDDIQSISLTMSI